MSRDLRIVALLLLLSVVACFDRPDDSGPVCTTEVRSGITLKVYDAETEENISCDVTVVMSEGDFTETLDRSLCDEQISDSEPSLFGLMERAGVYSMVISADGYQGYSEDDIVIEEDECHVITQLVEVDLAPLP